MTLTTRLPQDYSVEAHNCSGDSVGRSGCGRLTVGGATLAASGAYTCLVTAAGAGQGSSPFREDSDTKTIVVAGEVVIRGCKYLTNIKHETRCLISHLTTYVYNNEHCTSTKDISA